MMSSKITVPRKKELIKEKTLRGSASSSSSSGPTTGRELAACLLEVLDYITAHSDGTTELVDSVKPRLEAILRDS